MAYRAKVLFFVRIYMRSPWDALYLSTLRGLAFCNQVDQSSLTPLILTPLISKARAGRICVFSVRGRQQALALAAILITSWVSWRWANETSEDV